MRRWMILVAALLLYWLLPSASTELGQLRPAGVLYLTMEEKNIRLETDMGDFGVGETLDGALADLRQCASGVVFLDTAEYLVLNKSAVFLLPQLQQLLRPSVRICLAEGELDLEAAYAYLSNHIPGHVLSEAAGEPTMQRLIYKGERFILEE